MYLNDTSSERIIYRELKSSDEKIWLEYLNNVEAMKYMSKLNMTSEERAKSWINSQIQRYKDNQYGLLALISKETGEFIGQCGLLTQEIDGRTEIEIGYHLLPSQWKKGYATEAALHMRDFAFKNKLTDSLISIIKIDNSPSRAVAQRNGMTFEKQTTFKGFDVVIYRIGNN